MSSTFSLFKMPTNVHDCFVNNPMLSKTVIHLPGIGVWFSSQLQNAGFIYVSER